MRYPAAMRFPKEQLVRLGTAALADAADECLVRRPKRGPGLRMVLAMLWGLGSGPREPYVAFWKACGLPDGRGDKVREAAIRRHKLAWAAYKQILAGLGNDWPGGGAEAGDTAQRRWRADRLPLHPGRSGNDTRMIAPTKSCGWL